MRVVLILIAFTYVLLSQEIILKPDGKYRFLSNVHLVDGIAYKKGNYYQGLIEIPAGTTAKWEVNHKTGNMEWDFRDGKPRKVQFLGYPGNYGFIPQTILDKNEGGDGDPLDIIVLGTSVKRASVQEIKILGAIKLLDEGEHDDKIIAVVKDGPFANINSVSEMMIQFPGSIQIVRYWFEGYDQGSMQFIGYMQSGEAKKLIEKAHKSWSRHHNE